ncbi:MAG TPA: NAD(P)-dependent oxidoreductase [Stellaceae bacterium]|nr:NAD(P)-dependent oxidoreductase [Stellaceae bacterium]
MTGRRIVAVGRARSIRLFTDVVERLRGLGHDVVFHPDYSAFDGAGAGLADADVLLAASSFTCSRKLLAAANRLRGIVSPTTGVEGFDIEAATELGILVANGQIRETVDGMAEATVLLVLASLYDLRGSEALLRENRPRPPEARARMLGGKTVGMIGFGQIARAVADRLATWNVAIQTYTRRVPTDLPRHVRVAGLDQLLRTSDAVCVLATLNRESLGLLNADRLRLLKREAVLVNVARGAIIDEAALCEIARRRPDLRLALDVFTEEPLPPHSPLRDLPNAILTPHMLGQTREALAALPETAVDNVQAILAGRAPRHVCNPEVIPRWQARWGAAEVVRLSDAEPAMSSPEGRWRVAQRFTRPTSGSRRTNRAIRD